MVLVTGCGGAADPDGAGSPSPSGSAPSETAASTQSAGPTTSVGETSTPSGGTTTSGTALPPAATSTADRTGEPAGGVVHLTSVTATATGSSEQIVIASTGRISGWTLRYVDAVIVDDEPYLVDGNAALELVLRAADPTGDQGFVAAVADPLYPGLPLIQEVALADYLGSEVTFAIGVSTAAAFSVNVTEAGLTITFTG